ncbi:MAG: hypothetical protein ACRDHX_03975 [Chloroflexota bacterium]
MPPRPAPRRSPPPRRVILWQRAIPIFILMLAALYLADSLLQRFYHQTPSIVVSLVAGIVGAFLISRFATKAPPTPPSKSQQRRAAATKRSPEPELEEPLPVLPAARANSSRARRRRR